VSCGET